MAATVAEAPAPRANPALIGHAAAERALIAAWRSGRMPHAWLIGGPRGIGKATLAYRVARFVLAGGRGETLHVSPDHPTFRRVASGGHADLMSLEPGLLHPDTNKPTDKIIVAHVRRLAEFLRLTSAEAGWRVAVVDPAEAMNRNAANALLKILEEPPRRCLLLLTSHAPGRLLATIRSRCRMLALSPLAEPDLVGLIERLVPDLSGADRTALLRLAEGSIGRALDLAGQGGVELYREVLALLEPLPALDIPAVHALTDRLARGGDETGFRIAVELLSTWIVRLVKAAVHRGGGGPEVVAGEGKIMTRLAAGRGLDPWIAVWDKIDRLAARTEGANLDRKQVLLDAFLLTQEAARARPDEIAPAAP
ncbi:MAG: DNA polymerase III subunit delta' [Pseudomonadota bacterium]